MMDYLTGYLDNMAAAAINSGSTFEQYTQKFNKLVNNNTTLNNNVDKQQKELTDLCRKNNLLKNKLSAAAEPGGGGNELKSVGVSNTDLPGCGPSSMWVKDAY